MKKCPYCAEEIQDAAIECKHCRRDLPSQAPALSPYEQSQLKLVSVGGGPAMVPLAAPKKKAIGCTGAFGIACLVVLALAMFGYLVGPPPTSSQSTPQGTLVVGVEAPKLAAQHPVRPTPSTSPTCGTISGESQLDLDNLSRLCDGGISKELRVMSARAMQSLLWIQGIARSTSRPPSAHSTHRDQSVHTIVITGTTAS